MAGEYVLNWLNRVRNDLLGVEGHAFCGSRGINHRYWGLNTFTKPGYTICLLCAYQPETDVQIINGRDGS